MTMAGKHESEAAETAEAMIRTMMQNHDPGQASVK
jgi:hypothetical protein